MMSEGEVRELMEKRRLDWGYSFNAMSERCKCTVTLLKMVMDGETTHPNIVKRIQKAYRLTDRQAEMLMPVIHRKHGPDYEPDRYVSPEDINYRPILVGPKYRRAMTEV